jgi:hypothetical protein
VGGAHALRCEAEDLKLESFVIVLLYAIGTVYVTKVSGFLVLILVHHSPLPRT